MKLCYVAALGMLLSITINAQAVETRTVNDGKLILEDIPEIPKQIEEDLNRYQNTRSAAFLDWAGDGKQLYISTRFGDVRQIHRVAAPGAMRHQLTFFDEPIGSMQRQPEGELLSFTMDAGGSENAQIFKLDPATGESTMLSDGKSRNGALLWDHKGESIAFHRKSNSSSIHATPSGESSSQRIS